MGILPAALQKIQDDFTKEFKSPDISYISFIREDGVVIKVVLENEEAGKGLPETYKGYKVSLQVRKKDKDKES